MTTPSDPSPHEREIAAVTDVFDILKERGFVAQATDVDELRLYLSDPSSCYIGFDPTANSLHVGSLVPIMALAHMQRAGHRPIVVVGGGTGLVGDPSGKTEMRQMLTLEQIEANVDALRVQLSRFLDFADDKAIMANNADWLVELRYIDFLRDIGKHFSVNRMLAAESYKIRMETGLNFIEFNYMLLQSYDFYHLAKVYDCRLQMGGDDQWGNIVAGIDLVRKKLKKSAHCITFPLLTTASGAKMGKTAAGAVWLSADRTSPFDFYQFWINTDDRDVERFLKLYTFLAVSEIAVVATLEGRDLNAAKSILAYEVTKLVHGREAALAAMEAASAVFGERRLQPELLSSSDIPRTAGEKADGVPTTIVSLERLQAGIAAFDLFAQIQLCDSKSGARRLIKQGGAYVNEDRINGEDFLIRDSHLRDGSLLLKAGKKKVHRIKAG